MLAEVVREALELRDSMDLCRGLEMGNRIQNVLMRYMAMGNMTLVTLCCRLGVVRRKRHTSFLYIGISWTLAIVYLCCQDEEK